LATNDFSLVKNGYHAGEQKVRMKTVRKYKEGLTFWKSRESTSDYIENKRARGTHVLDRVDEGPSQDIEYLEANGRVRGTHVLSSAEGEVVRRLQKASELGELTKFWRAHWEGHVRSPAWKKAIEWVALTPCQMRRGKSGHRKSEEGRAHILECGEEETGQDTRRKRVSEGDSHPFSVDGGACQGSGRQRAREECAPTIESRWRVNSGN